MSPVERVRLRAAGSDAVLLDCGSLAGALEVLTALTAAGENGALRFDELVSAAETVLVRGGEARDARAFEARLGALLEGGPAASARADGGSETLIPVSYDGVDLAEVAELTGMSVDQVIARHSAPQYTVAFTGFAPGFAYLSGGDPALDVPRRSSPRPRIDAGSVGLAGPFSGVYPRRSPGGWQLIGRTDTVMWDLDRERPALLIPGDRVRFAPVRASLRVTAAAETAEAAAGIATERAGRPGGTGEPGGSRDSGPSAGPSLTVVSPGLNTTIQDRGRPGLAAMGVSASGAADRGALDSANRLVGNDPSAAVLELGLGEFAVRARAETVLAITGAPRPGRITGALGERPVPQGRAFELSAGETLTLAEPGSGLRTVLALRGGVDAPSVLGSAARDTLAGLGPAPLEAGGTVQAGRLAVTDLADPAPTRGRLPRADRVAVLRVVPGPRDDWFAREDPTGAARLWNQIWSVTPSSDRVGVRLAGAPLSRSDDRIGVELPSEGLVTGALQVPPDGQPVLFLADHPLTGGYPVIGVVCEEDLDLAAQLPAGARVRFVPHAPPSRSSHQRERAMSSPSDTPARPISTVLVANRGEIAVRVIRAAREAGLRSVAVYADGEADALHVRAADDAYALHGETPDETYLDIGKLLEAARLSGADAVHPGYGFLSESSAFARAVTEAGLVWIGPDPETIELLGDKARARTLAAQVGAPLVPGTNSPVRTAADVEAFADAHGLPIAIKAVHGGGGRGMRVVHEREAIAEAYESAVREAVGAFGQGECLVERFLERPRHIEAQVLGDRTGRIAVLGTRDCSLQRRNQKLIEEAPAPFLSDGLRERIHRAASDICGAAGYVGAGTVEFLLGSDGTLSFLEVNTRLQVEHPVTEQVTGIDLVQEQFRIAAGDPMRVPDEIPIFGHAIEFRINAEDPGLDYLPTPGTLTRFDPPGGQGVRLDSGFEAGQAIPGSFDSLLAKLIIWGRDREEALARARRALAEFEIEGVASVLPFDRFVVEDPAFTATGEAGFAVHTRWIEEECSAEFSPAAANTAPGEDRTPDPGDVLAPFAGTLSSWRVADGSTVAEGDTVAIVEAMKMEVPIRAPRAGRLRHGLEAGSPTTARQPLGTVE